MSYYIKKAQEELKKANLYKGDIDGDFGKVSYEAVVEAISINHWHISSRR